ncbi:MAG: DnaJ family domain-containing protein [Betaproteobacteria bacterium]
MTTLDEEIARQLKAAAESGELAAAEGYGKPLVDTPGWDATPGALRMPFKILKDAGVAPAEVGMFNERARLRAEIDACTDEARRETLLRELGEIQQKLALRLESLRANATL